ncbi:MULTISPECIES: PD-(D/E)XK nuclease family protein [unclassified Curtobacterium]|uniref:PD-(D/E)XK nuclease family protein n=1 Tax=unclassified Curtobacterium TaxID=257496 RepID=UPI0008DE65E1|nr:MULTISPECIES: PD-(D/E)XK nuclease family protein [unclassified Curtobacterium]WIA96777.1 hypothetical protein QOL16_17040 [Curtobacterium sp. MCBA15_004]WIB00079.1 hypothetical protein QOL15_16460 [Curtobacterium sp. MCBA15_012]
MGDNTIFMLRGQLVHRAVLWPFTRPLVGDQLRAVKDPEFVKRRAVVASTVLARALENLLDGGSDLEKDTALGLVNLEGPRDVTTFEPEWQRLSTADRREVLIDLDRYVINAANGIAAFIREVGLTGGLTTCVWSEVPLFMADGFFNPVEGVPTRLRVDLVVWRQRGVIDVLDLKVGNANPPDWVLEKDRKQLALYVEAVKRRAPGTTRVRAKLLYVGRGHGASRFEALTP